MKDYSGRQHEILTRQQAQIRYVSIPFKKLDSMPNGGLGLLPPSTPIALVLQFNQPDVVGSASGNHAHDPQQDLAVQSPAELVELQLEVLNSLAPVLPSCSKRTHDQVALAQPASSSVDAIENLRDLFVLVYRNGLYG